MKIIIDKKYRPKNRFILNKEFLDFIHILKTYARYVKKEHIVIEVGASTRSRTNFISKLCHKLIAIEYVPERRQENFSNVVYKIGDWQTLSRYIKPNSANILISTQCLEHVKNDLSAINETHKVLKKGGVAIINTPNRLRLTQTILKLFGKERKFPYWEHFREYTERDLIALIKTSKFNSYIIESVCLGIQPRRFFCLKKCPKFFRKWCSHWEIVLIK